MVITNDYKQIYAGCIYGQHLLFLMDSLVNVKSFAAGNQEATLEVA